MVFKQFRVQVATRVIILAVVITAAIFAVQTTDLIAAGIVLLLFALWLVIMLIRYVERTNHDLTRFLESIRYADFTQSFGDRRLGTTFQDLYASFSNIIEDFQRTRSEKEEHRRYLQTVVQHIGVGLIAFSTDGKVDLINAAARRLLRVNTLSNILQLEHSVPELISILQAKQTMHPITIKVRDGDTFQQWMVNTTIFKLHDRLITLASIQNIQNELDEKEMEAWQNLIRVLTHEIMNSVTPIASLAATADGLLNTSPSDEALGVETRDDIRAALTTIRTRSDGLIHFVQSYRNLSHLPKPNLEIIRVTDLFTSISKLMRNQADQQRIHLTTHVDPPGLEVTADHDLIEQVLINLILNAIHALEGRDKPHIKLTSGLDDRGRVWINVEDNGIGMPESVQDRIFIPFFTTRKSGSGIGLSLSRQILRLHGGTLTVRSREDEGSVFTLRF